jgi:LPXTG-site transpeptidase (sortase) family protein
MIRAWPAAVRRVQPSTRVVGEIVLVALLVVSAAATWRDGPPTDGFVELVAPPLDGIAALQVSGNNPSGYPRRGQPPPVVVDAAPPPQPRIPTSPPAQLLIPLLDVHRAVEKVGVDQSGVMELPVNSWNAGWYKGSAVPGAPGDSVIEGHAGYPGKPMIFGKLDTLHTGDRIIVVLADGTHRLFLVQSMRTVPAGSAVPGLADPYGLPRLTLITCTGHFDKTNHWYSDRLVLEARYAGLA